MALSLIDLADKTCKALRCTNQLDTSTDPEILALQAKLAQQTKLTTQVFRAINETLDKTQHSGKQQHYQKNKGLKYNDKQSPVVLEHKEVWSGRWRFGNVSAIFCANNCQLLEYCY